MPQSTMRVRAIPMNERCSGALNIIRVEKIAMCQLSLARGNQEDGKPRKVYSAGPHKSRHPLNPVMFRQSREEANRR